jgi:hypothetical protein
MKTQFHESADLLDMLLFTVKGLRGHFYINTR